MKSGVYLIKNITNGKCYVGSSIHLELRQKEHFAALASNRHINKHLQNAYNKYGRSSFEFEIVETIPISENIKELLLEREQFWIDNLKPDYNILLVAGSTLGFHHSEETKKKISESTKGVKKSEEHAKHIREAQKGKTLTEEHIENLKKGYQKRTNKSPHKAIISIDGVIYNSIKEASEQTGVKYNTIQKRLVNPKFSNYFYVKYTNSEIKNERLLEKLNK